MKNSKRAGADAAPKKRQAKPFLDVSMYIPVGKKLEVFKESKALLFDYVQYKMFSNGRDSSASIDSKSRFMKPFLLSLKSQKKVSIKFSCSQDSDSKMNDYLKFVNFSTGSDFTEGSIIDGLAEKLFDDLNFLDWRKVKVSSVLKEETFESSVGFVIDSLIKKLYEDEKLNEDENFMSWLSSKNKNINSVVAEVQEASPSLPS